MIEYYLCLTYSNISIVVIVLIKIFITLLTITLCELGWLPSNINKLNKRWKVINNKLEKKVKMQ